MKKVLFLFLIVIVFMKVCTCVAVPVVDFVDKTKKYDCRILPGGKSVAISNCRSLGTNNYFNVRGIVHIPDTVINPANDKKYVVTTIDTLAYVNCDEAPFSVQMGNNITSILHRAFNNSYLDEITMGKNIRKIGDSAFMFFSTKVKGALKSITLKCLAPPILDRKNYTFRNVSPTITFNVPCGATQMYKADVAWKMNLDLIPEAQFVEVVPVLDIKYNDYQGVVDVTKYNTCEDHDIIFEAIPNEHYIFYKWSDGDETNPRTITMSEDDTLSALFKAEQYTITLSCDGEQGSVSGMGVYDYDEEVTIKAEAKEGYEFVRWSDGNIESTRSFVIQENIDLTALFQIKRCVVSLSCDENQGMVSGSGTYDYGKEVTIEAVAYEGYVFDRWSDGDTTNPRTIVVKEAITLEAFLKTRKYSLHLTCDEEQGMVVGAGEYDYNAQVMIVAFPYTTYEFYQWSDGSRTNPRTIIITEDTSLEALFRLKGTPLPSIIEDEVSTKIRKVVRDGQMIIIGTDGHEYKVTGEMIK